AARSSEGLWALLKKPAAISFLLGGFLLQMSHGPYYTFFTIYLDELGFSRIASGSLWALGVIAEVVLFLFMHRLLQRFSLRTLLAASIALAALRWLLIGSGITSWPLLIVAQCLHAASFGSFHAAAIAWVHQSFRGHAGQGQALYSSVGFGAGWAAGAVLSGILWEQIGSQIFLWAALVAAVTTLVMLAGLRVPAADAQKAQEVE